MTTLRPAIFALLAVMALTSNGCRLFRQTPKAPSLPPVPAAAPAAPQPAPVEPATAEPKPSPTAVVPVPPVPEPAPPAPGVHPPKPKPIPAQAPAQPPPTPPALGQILTPQQQTEFRRSYQQSAQAARQALSQLSGRALTRDQADTANRIRSFLIQADEAQPKDPSTAAQLARRAEILARDLINSIR